MIPTLYILAIHSLLVPRACAAIGLAVEEVTLSQDELDAVLTEVDLSVYMIKYILKEDAAEPSPEGANCDTNARPL